MLGKFYHSERGVSGYNIPWEIADKDHNGYPTGSVTLITEYLVMDAAYDAMEPTSGTELRKTSGNNRYRHSNIRQWLNSTAAAGAWYTAQHSTDAPPSSNNVYGRFNPYSTAEGFLYGFTEDERDLLLDTTINAARATADSGSFDTLTDKIFLPSFTELGLSNSDADYTNGTALAMFIGASESIYDRRALVSTDPEIIPKQWNWWTRDARRNVPNQVYRMYIDVNGTGPLVSYEAAFSGLYNFIRPCCNISGDALVSDSPDASGYYTFVYNQEPTVPSSITVSETVYGGQNVAVSWGASTDADGNFAGYVLEKSEDGGAWAQIYNGTARTFSAAVTYGIGSVQFRVKAYDTEGAASGYVTSASRTVTNNRAPTLSQTSGMASGTDLGTFSDSPPYFECIVYDADGDVVTVAITLDGAIIGSWESYSGSPDLFYMSYSDWMKVLNGPHTIAMTATDPSGASTTHMHTFTKDVNTVSVVQTAAMPADAMPTKALVNIQGKFPTGCVLKLEICNNGFDDLPMIAWEDITTAALNGQKHYFTNTWTQYGQWGVMIRATLERGTATETCYIQSIGGNFE